jgi:gamma-glutamylcyclotransferase (GGCT)/AIG2-like uncharacterized protein YtfP
MKVFVYGTLKKGFYNDYVLEGSKFLGKVKLKVPFKMYDLGQFPALVLATNEKQNTIEGEVYEIDKETLKSLDALEGYPLLYDRGLIKTKYGKSIVYYMKGLPSGTTESKFIKSGKWTKL